MVIFNTVPNFPHMISVTHDNGYETDDILLDKIAVISNIACNMGEIMGPLFSGFVNDIIGLNESCAILALASFLYGLLYFFGNGMHKMCKEKVKKSVRQSFGLYMTEKLRP